MSVTSGDSLASTGIPAGTSARTAASTREAASGSQANTSPRLSTFGQEMFTSTATSAGAGAIRRASSA